MADHFFNRDISWLAFNYRVLQEADDLSLPLYERIKFLAIYANNLEEFYRVRVAEHRSVLTIEGQEMQGKAVQRARKTLDAMHDEVTRQMHEFTQIFSRILPELEEQRIVLCQGKRFKPAHLEYINDFFNDEVLPYLQPIMVKDGAINAFLRDNRVYVSVKMYKKNDDQRLRPKYAAIKLPQTKLPRFIRLPQVDGQHFVVFLEDVIKLQLNNIFPGYDIEASYCIRVSRDADLMIEDELDGNLVNKIRRSLSRRKTGLPSRFLHEQGMPSDMVKVIRHAFNIHKTDVVEGGFYLSLEDLFDFPNPYAPELELVAIKPLRVRRFDQESSIFKTIKQGDVMVQYPYHSYDYLIRFLMEASYDNDVDEIMVTQYRVASNSAVVNSLISAAQNGKRVTVFVELKARFDEETNLHSAAMMEKAGVKIIYSIPNLKVHSKVALVRRKNRDGEAKTSYAYLSTGNFNEKTARIYSDFGLFTANPDIIEDLRQLFIYLNDTDFKPHFSCMLLAQFNLVDEMVAMIEQEMEQARAGRKAHIIIKMNAIQDPYMIKKLYEASAAGVQIQLIIRGICCLIPGQEFSRNITVTRIVDRFLEHARVWYFYADGQEALFMGSPDWMRRNLYRRIETVFPILDPDIKATTKDYLHLQLHDNVKGTFINAQLEDVPKPQGDAQVRSQYAMYDYWKSR